MPDCSKVYKDVKIKLEMSALEAAVLHQILQRVGGNPEQTLRGVSEQINNSLERVLAPNLWGGSNNIAGINKNSPFYDMYEALTGSVTFNPDPKTREQHEADLQFHLANN